ncbi:uncharacterized protein LOC143185066 [Calliopsis andreniformis]|uniref:uncharacterized protein LOC143185066 n=1 Tax=Calliopsis andreniformis TaxID=337506 RepID=UPI003FCE2D6C
MNWNKERLYNLTNEIDKDWREQTVSDEIEIIINYMSKGRLYTIVYTGFLYLILLVYFSALLFPYVLNIVSPLNETRSLNYIYPAEYFINEEENFVWILTIETISCYFGIGILLAHDTMLILYVQYICAMFAIVGHRLEHTLYKLHDENYLCVARKKRMYTEFVGSCVQTHRKALYFVDLLESCFMLSQLIILSLNVVCLAVTLASISTLAGSIDSLRFILYASGQLLHIFYVSYQSEKLISHSLTVSKSVYNGTWYNIPQEVQKMLLFILRRANIPSYLTAGKIVVFSIQTFSVVVQNSMSYFMVLTSLN